MSEFEAARSTSTTLIAVVVIIIIAGGGLAVMFLGGGLGPTTTTTTTTTSTTGTTDTSTTTTDTSTTTTTTTTTIDTSPKVLTVLTRHDTTIHGVFEPAFLVSDFAKTHNIVDIDWKTPSAPYWDDLIDAGLVDVCWGGGPTLFDQLMRDGRLQAWDNAFLLEIADRVNDTIAGSDMKRYNVADDLMWVAAAISSFGFTVNHQFLDDHSMPTPTTWTDLADPIYGSALPTFPSIAMGNAPDTTSNTRIYEIMTQGLGWDEGWINMARMVGQANIYGGSVQTQEAVETGEVGIAMSIDFYGYLTQRNNPDCEYIIPEGQTFVNGDPIAIPVNTDYRYLAEGFIDFILSPYGQALWLDEGILRMPVMEAAFWEDIAAGADDLYAVYNQTTATVGIDFDDSLSVAINAAFIEYWESVFTDAQAELISCWTAILNAYDNGWIDISEVDYYASLMGTPITIIDPESSLVEQFTVDYATRINHDMIYNPTYASDVKAAWQNAAKAQYIYVESLVPTSPP